MAGVACGSNNSCRFPFAKPGQVVPYSDIRMAKVQINLEDTDEGFIANITFDPMPLAGDELTPAQDMGERMMEQVLRIGQPDNSLN